MKISRFDEIFVAKCAKYFRLCSTLDYLRMFCVPFGHEPCVPKETLVYSYCYVDVKQTLLIEPDSKQQKIISEHINYTQLDQINNQPSFSQSSSPLMPLGWPGYSTSIY